MSAYRIARRTAPALLALAVAAGCATNPVTGETELSLVSEGQEIQMGQQGAQQVEASIGLVDDAALQQYVDRIGQRMAAASERPNLPWRFGVVEDPTPNAFALPGGFIYVTRGLLGLMDSEAELASVLGHEIGHVTAKHSVNQMSKAQLAQLGLGLGSVFLPQVAQFGNLAGAGLQLLFLKYGRDDERQADDLGYRYALEQGYDVRHMVDVFASLARASQSEGQSPLPSWLATHPYPEERIERINERLAAAGPELQGLETGREQFLRQIDGMAYGENPRNGFFRDGLFLHPDLRFRIQFPNGWATQNLPQAVIAMSPQQDAAIQLTLVPDARSPDDAARMFANQQGVQVGNASRQNVNGMTATLLPFQAATEQGTVTGIVGFLAHGNHIYSILGYGPGQAYRTHGAAIERTIGSFDELTDRSVLNIQPPRIDIVQVDRQMTLAQFASRYPSSIGLDELALINQLGGPDSVIEAGRMMKRVTAG